MSFLYPTFLFALGALSIPVIVHLFNFRKYKKVYFTNVRFLKELQQESKSKSKLKRLLILMSRLLALTFLVLAFAQPYLPGKHTLKKGKRSIHLYLDNSFSMQALTKRGSLFDETKRRARELVESAAATDHFQIISNDFYRGFPGELSKEQALEVIDKLDVSPSVKSLQQVYDRALSNGHKNTSDAAFFLISDFQKSNWQNFKPDTNLETNFVFLTEAPAQNVFIDSCFVESPYFQAGSNQKMHVKIRNTSDKDIENGSLKLYLNAKQIAPLSYQLPAHSNTEVVLNFTCRDTGIQQGMLIIEDFPVTFDDTLFFAFPVSSRIPCLNIHKKEDKTASFIQSLYGKDSIFLYRDQVDQSVDFSVFNKSNLIVLCDLQTLSSGLSQELGKFILSGGSVLLFPSETIDKEAYHVFLNMLSISDFVSLDTMRYYLDSKNLPTDLYEGVFQKIPENMDMPMVFKHYTTLANSRSGEEVLLKLLNGQPFLSLYRKGKGRVYICTSPLSEKASGFAKHALFIPSLIKIAILSRPSAPLYYTCAANEAIDVSNLIITGESPMHILSLENKTDFIPELKITENKKQLLTHDYPAYAGNYVGMLQKNKLCGIGFNYDRKESDLTCFTEKELKEMIREKNWKHCNHLSAAEINQMASLADIGGGTRLWKVCILFALLFLAIEICLIKFLK